MVVPMYCLLLMLNIMKMEYYLARNDQKKARLLTLLKTYARDKNVENLAHSVALLLNNPMEKKLLTEIR